jgi:MFS family permease
MSAVTDDTGVVKSLVPARMDRLPWTHFHWLVVVGLGVSWVLDGLEIQMVSNVGSVLTEPGTLGLTSLQVGLLASFYLAGQVVGALFFGNLTDRLGRKRLFILTLAIYLIGSGLAGLSLNLEMLLAFRFIAGLGIGGEYTAINSAIDELIPSHYRGRVDIAVNGTYWGGAVIGAIGGTFLLNPDLVPINWGWRIAFLIGPVLGLSIIYLRRHIPESPRWLMTHGREVEAEATVDEIEERVRAQGIELSDVDESKALSVKAHPPVSYIKLAKVMFTEYRKRAVLGATMMITQSFLYNAIFFTYALVLKNFYQVDNASLYFIPFALGNLAGPLALGHLFDTIGRRKMIFATYGISAVILAVSAALFHAGVLTATTQTILWCICFFFASAGASSAYLTVSEIFPLELRGQAIAFFFAIGQLAGLVAPALYGALIGDGSSRGPLTVGYFIGAAVMAIGGVVALVIGVNAERMSLEDIAEPLSSVRRSSATRMEGPNPLVS